MTTRDKIAHILQVDMISHKMTVRRSSHRDYNGILIQFIPLNTMECSLSCDYNSIQPFM